MGFFSSGGNSAADEEAHEDGREGDGQQRGGGHRIGLGKGQRFEQPSFLRLEREHRDKGDRDDQQRIKQVGPTSTEASRMISQCGFCPGRAPCVCGHFRS